MSNDITLKLMMILGIVGWVLILGAMIGVKKTTKEFQAQAIELGYAEYNPTNGVWGWKQ